MEEHEIPGTSVRVVKVAGDEANASGSQSGRSAAKQKLPRYRTMEQKLQNIERYLIWQVDFIRKWVLVAVVTSAVSAAAVIVLLLTVLNAPDRESVTGRGKGTAEPEVRTAAPATENGAVPATAVAPKAETVTTDANARAGSATDDRPKAKAAAADSANVALVKDSAADDKLKARAAAADRANVALVKDSPADDVDAPAPPEAVDLAPKAEDVTAVAPEKPVRVEDPSPTAVMNTTTAPIHSTPSASAGAEKPWSFRIADSAIASGMAGLVPKGTADRFSGSQNRLYCWTRIESDSFSRIPRNSRYVIHRWIHKGETVRERKITIGSPRYRAYSVLPGPGDRPGQWRVEIIDAEGRVIGTEKFVIQ